jgi:hypothetical protein
MKKTKVAEYKRQCGKKPHKKIDTTGLPVAVAVKVTMCTNKSTFETKEDADRWIRTWTADNPMTTVINRAHGKILRSYQCPICNKHHTTTKPETAQ